MKREYQIIAVDFDGTLCTDCFPDIGQPNTALIELLQGLKQAGTSDYFMDVPLWKTVRGSSRVVQKERTGV